MRSFKLEKLRSSPLYKNGAIPDPWLTQDRRVQLSLQRAKALLSAYELTERDVSQLTSSFWDMHADPLIAIDIATSTLVTIQVNLVAGTIAKYTQSCPSLLPLLERILRFDVISHYCLTEVGHGLDAINIETTATLLPDGRYDLHTPTSAAAKMMPPTYPCGVPAIAIVFARLIIKDLDYGVRPFLVDINNGTHMERGITSKLLPQREGSEPVLHSITSFHHVHLPGDALLGPRGVYISNRGQRREEHIRTIWRTTVGTMAISSFSIPFLLRAAYITARFSQERTVGASDGSRVSILSFRTQQAPIVTALSTCFVLIQFWRAATRSFSDEKLPLNVRAAYAAIFKATAMDHAQTLHLALAERCGARGLFAFNGITSQFAGLRAASIAEGDILGVCIRLASELLLKRYEIPAASNPNGILAQHEASVFAELYDSLQEAGHQRSDKFNRKILPKSEAFVRAIGHRMAYEAAEAAGLDKEILNLYLVLTLRTDQAWYTEKGLHSRASLDAMEDEAIGSALPHLDEWLERTGMAEYAQVPIVSAQRWEDFVSNLPASVGRAKL